MAPNSSTGGGALEMRDDDNNNGFTLAVLGCGTMGIAILSGIFASLESEQADRFHPKPTKFVATVRRKEGTERILKELGQYRHSSRLAIYCNDNVQAAREADVVLLCCAPHAPAKLLQQVGMKEALDGKILVHILAGVTNQSIRDLIGGCDPGRKCQIVKAMPNAAAAVRQSITVIEASEPPLNEETQDLITWLFEQVGRVVVLPASCMDIVTVLGGSVPAMTAALIDSLAAGAIEMGCPMKESYTIAAQAMIGAATMVVQGEHPAVVRDGCSCPGGCTAKALAVMEEGGVRGTLGSAIREGVAKAKGLGSTEA